MGMTKWNIMKHGEWPSLTFPSARYFLMNLSKRCKSKEKKYEIRANKWKLEIQILSLIESELFAGVEVFVAGADEVADAG